MKWSRALDNQDNILVGGLDSSVCRYDGKTWQVISPRDVRQHLGNFGVRLLAADKSGNVWAVTWGNLERYDGKFWHTLTEAHGWTSPYVPGTIQDL